MNNPNLTPRLIKAVEKLVADAYKEGYKAGLVAVKPTCPKKDKSGRQCGLPAGHLFGCQNGWGGWIKGEE